MRLDFLISCSTISSARALSFGVLIDNSVINEVGDGVAGVEVDGFGVDV